MLVGEVLDALEKARLRLNKIHRLHDDRGKLVGMFFEQGLQTTEVVVRKGMRQIAHCLWNSCVACSAADVPILPAMVTAARNAVAASESACGADRARRGIRTVLAEANHLRTRNQAGEALGEFDLNRMR